VLIQAWEEGHFQNLPSPLLEEESLWCQSGSKHMPVWRWNTRLDWATDMLVSLFEEYISGGRHFVTNLPRRIRLTHHDHLLISLGRHVGYSHAVSRFADAFPECQIAYIGPTPRLMSERRVKQGRRNIHCASLGSTRGGRRPDYLVGRNYDLLIFEVSVRQLPDFDVRALARQVMPHRSPAPVIMCVADMFGEDRPTAPVVYVSPSDEVHVRVDPLGFITALREHQGE